MKNFGEKNYIYIGDSYYDIAIWNHSAGAIVVTEDEEECKEFTSKINVPYICSINKWHALKGNLIK